MSDILDKITEINKQLDCKIRNRVGITTEMKLFEYYKED